jgi:hypothetical protein
MKGNPMIIIGIAILFAIVLAVVVVKNNSRVTRLADPEKRVNDII